MILNHRPTTPAHLDILVEELSSRIAEDEQHLILEVIRVNLGNGKEGGEVKREVNDVKEEEGKIKDEIL